jgi:hypothetical protein
LVFSSFCSSSIVHKIAFVVLVEFESVEITIAFGASV